MGSVRTKLRHAFAVDPPGPAEPTPPQQAPVDWVCEQVVKRQLATPALFFLEMSRPLNYVGSQLGHVMAPGVWAIVRQLTYERYKHFLAFLERRGSMEYLSQRIEYFEAERKRRRSESAARQRSEELTPNDEAD